jgi:hypothetical protein
VQVLAAAKQLKIDPDDTEGALARIGTTIGLFTKTYRVVLPNAVKIPEVAFQAMKRELYDLRNRELDYINFLIETYSLLSPTEQQEPDKLKHFQKLSFVKKHLEEIPMETPKYNEAVSRVIAKIDAFFSDETNAAGMVQIIISTSLPDRETVDLYIEGLDIEKRILVRSMLRKLIDESPLKGTTEEQQRIILQNGWLAAFAKWLSALAAVPVNLVMATWDWIRFMKREYEHAEGVLGVGIFAIKNATGFEIGRNFWNRTVAGLLATSYVTSPEYGAAPSKKYLNPYDFIKVGTVMSNKCHGL